MAAAVAVLAGLLAACNKAGLPTPPTVPPPVAPEVAASTPTSLAQPAAPAPAPVVASEPQLGSMHVAKMTSKMGVPGDLRYQFDGDALSGQPVTLHLAAVPRVAGTNLVVSIKQVPGIEAVQEVLGAQKVDASAAYRRQLSVRRDADGPTELRVLVTMDLPMGSAFSYFSVPLVAAPPAGKKSSIPRHE
jgi:hypothetical protein